MQGHLSFFLETNLVVLEGHALNSPVFDSLNEDKHRGLKMLCDPLL